MDKDFIFSCYVSVLLEFFFFLTNSNHFFDNKKNAIFCFLRENAPTHRFKNPPRNPWPKLILGPCILEASRQPS